jgi:hypothetical protein
LEAEQAVQEARDLQHRERVEYVVKGAVAWKYLTL